MLAGGRGVISVFGNAFPKEMKWLVDSALKEKSSSARVKMEEDFDKLFGLMFIEGNPAGVKALLEMRDLCKNILRLPLIEVTEATKSKIKAEFEKFA